MTIYPNPTQANVTIDLSKLDETRVQIRVYDMMGRISLELPYSNIVSAKMLVLPTSGLAAGVYTIAVTGNANYVQKMVKADK